VLYYIAALVDAFCVQFVKHILFFKNFCGFNFFSRNTI